MKTKATILLVVLATSLLSPFSIHISLSDNDSPVLFTLDVCRVHDVSSSSSTDLPYLCECPANILISSVSGNLEPEQQIFIDLLIPSEEEKPPEV